MRDHRSHRFKDNWKPSCSDRTRSNAYKLKEEKFRVDIKKKVFTVRVVRDWNRLSMETVAAPALSVFKARWDGALSNLIKYNVLLSMSWYQMIFGWTSNPKHYRIL